MGHSKVRSISSAPLRLDAQVLRQAEGLARSAGVTVPELIELLLLGLLDADPGHVTLPARPERAGRPPATRRKPTRIVDMDDFRRRRRPTSSSPEAPERATSSVCVRSLQLRRRAAEARARSVQVREAAEQARQTAQTALDELSLVRATVS